MITTNHAIRIVKTTAFVITLVITGCSQNDQTTDEPEDVKSSRNDSANVPRDFATDPHLDKDVREFLKKLNSGGKPLESLSPIEAKKVLVDGQASVKVDLSGIDVVSKTITVEEMPIKLYVVRPKGVTGKLPVFVFVHGGGWVLGDYPTHERMVRDLVVRTGYACVFVDYTGTPDAQYPVAINEIYAATKWLSDHGHEVNVDGQNMAIVGNSVGANMAAVTAIMAKEKKGPEIKGLVLLWPIVDADFETESYKRYGKDRFLTTATMKWMYDMYIPDTSFRKVIYASPLRATEDQLRGLPPTLIITAENDILRDEGEAFGRKLDAAGVKVTTTRYNGTIHDFGLLNGLATLPPSIACFDQSATQLKSYLGK
jgi:acetyl esterase/lipase